MKKRASIFLLAGILFLTGCQGAKPAAESTSQAPGAAVASGSSAVSASSAMPEKMAPEWGTAGIGDTVTVAGRELTLQSFEINGTEIKINLSASDITKQFGDWVSIGPDSDPQDTSAYPFSFSYQYHLIVESPDGTYQDARPVEYQSFEMYFTFQCDDLPDDPTFHFVFVDDTGVIPGFTFS